MSLNLDELTTIPEYTDDNPKSDDAGMTYEATEFTGIIELFEDAVDALLKFFSDGLGDYIELMVDLGCVYDAENDIRVDRFFNGAHYINRPSVREVKHLTKQSYKPTPNKNYPYRRCDRSR